MWLSDMQKFGIGFCVAGGFFISLGVLMFFDRALLAMGNILLIVGIPLVLGPQATISFLLQRQKLRGTFAFAFGVFLILLRLSAILGFAVELYGLGVLFGDAALAGAGWLTRIPVIGPILGKVVETIRARAGWQGTELPV